MTASIFRFLLEENAAVAPLDSVAACHARIAPFDARFSSTVERAAAGGFVADRVGYAFMAGYRAALARLDPSISRASLCASEEGGAHPRAIKTRLSERDGAFVLDGDKTFGTLASAAETLLVVASRGERDGRNWLQIARIPAARAGVEIQDRPPTAFAPEIPHARIAFRAVSVDPAELLPGDGYADYLKPFRTIEDVHVIAAWLGHVVRLVRTHGEPPDTAERALAGISALVTIDRSDPNDRAVHLALAGVLAEAAGVAAGLRLEHADSAVRERWQRDLPLLSVARTARQLRREAAWSSFVPPAP